MEVAQKTFISSTFWTERIGPTAALKTLEIMKKIKSWEIITDIGNVVKNNWVKIAKNNRIEIKINGIPAISSYSFTNNNLKYKTLITQEMLKKGFLASNAFYACIAHKEKYIKSYFEYLDDIFHTISKCERDEIKIDDLLEGEVCHGGFYRLN